MKYILILVLIITATYADKVKKKALACPTIVQLQKAPADTKENYLDLNMYIIANSCIVLSKQDSIEAVDYNANNSKDLFTKIIYKKTGVLLYVRSTSILVEQDGKKGKFRF